MHDIPARQAVQHTVIDPRDPDLTIRLRPSPEDTERDDDTVPDVPPAESSAASETDGTPDPDTATDLQAKMPLPVTPVHQIQAVTQAQASHQAAAGVNHHPLYVLQHQVLAQQPANRSSITPTTADTSMQARQFYGEMLGRPLTRKEFKRQKTQFGRQLAILQQVSRRPENQLPTNEPKEPQPGTSKDSNDSDNVNPAEAKPPPRKKNNTQ